LIPVIYKKPNFLNTLQYVLGKKDAAIVDTNMPGKTPEEFNQKFLYTKYNNKAVKLQCAHLILSIAHRPDHHEHLSDSQCSYVAKEYLKDMGYLPSYNSPAKISQYVAVRHHDRDHEHLHIIASRIRLDGSRVNDSYDYFNSQVSTRRIAAELGLEVTPTTNEAVANRLNQEYGIITPTSPNRSKSIRAVNSKHKTPTSKEIIRSAIGEVIKDSPTVSAFIRRLEENNIGILPKMQGSELLGFTYIHNNVKLAGYQVYKPYSWNKLQLEYGVSYNRDRDIQALQEAKSKAISFINDDKQRHNNYTLGDKPTSNGDADGNSNSFINTEILDNNLNKELVIELKPEVKLSGEDKKTKKKVQPLQQDFSPEEEKSSVELSIPVHQNSPYSVETLPEDKLRQPSKEDYQVLQEVNFIEPENKSQKKNSLPEEEAPPEKPSRSPLASSIKHLPKIITDYMLVNNSARINGRELSASLDGDMLTVCRHRENIPVMQAKYEQGDWYENVVSRLTQNEIEQIESLRVFTQQALINRSNNYPQSSRGVARE
jgi:Relaxase/Mobilisation nuclease domain